VFASAAAYDHDLHKPKLTVFSLFSRRLVNVAYKINDGTSACP